MTGKQLAKKHATRCAKMCRRCKERAREIGTGTACYDCPVARTRGQLAAMLKVM